MPEPPASSLPDQVTVKLPGLAVGNTPTLLVGVLAAVKRNSIADSIATVTTLIGLSVPGFLLATLLVLAFSLWLRWLPPLGYVELKLDPLGNLRTWSWPRTSSSAERTSREMSAVEKAPRVNAGKARWRSASTKY